MVRSTLFSNTADEVKAFATRGGSKQVFWYKAAELRRDEVDQYLWKQVINLNA